MKIPYNPCSKCYDKKTVGVPSLSNVLFIFYIAITSNYINGLLAKQIRDYIDDNRLIQHVIGFFTMFIIITTFGQVIDTYTALFYAFIGYIWFIFSTKLDLHWNIMIIILLFIGYLYENSLVYKEEELRNDPNLDIKIREKIMNKDNNYKKWMLSLIVAITLIGTICYSYKKHVQYGGNYNLITYVLY